MITEPNRGRSHGVDNTDEADAEGGRDDEDDASSRRGEALAERPVPVIREAERDLCLREVRASDRAASSAVRCR